MILPLVTAPYIARVIGSEGIGIHTFYRSIASYFVLFAMLGMNNYGNRTIASIRDDTEKRNKMFSSMFSFQLIMSLVATVGYFIFVQFVAESNYFIAMLFIIYVLSAALDINWFFFGLEEFKMVVNRKIMFKIISVACIFLLVKTPEDLWIYSLIMCLELFFGQAIMWIFLRKHVSFVKPTIKEIFSHFRYTIILFVPSIVTFLYRELSKILLGFLGTMEDVGLFEYSEKVIMMCLGLISALGTVMLPKMAYSKAQNDYVTMKKYIIDSMQFAMILAFAIAFGYAAIAPEFSVVFFGDDFSSSSILMIGLSISVPFIAWANVIRMQYLIPNALDSVYLKSTIVGVIINISLNFILIPKMGALGAVIAAVTTEISVALTQTLLIKHSLDIKQYVLNAVPYAVIGIVMYFCVRLIASIFGSTIKGLILELVVGGFVYLSLCILYFIISKNDLAKRFYDLIKSKLFSK
jgi:O-antigen/teichoic acid export membrane protein